MSQCCCGKYKELDEPIIHNTMCHEPLGPVGNFCGPYTSHIIRDQQTMLDKMAEALGEIRRCIYKNRYSNYTLTDDFDPQVITKALQEYRERKNER